MTTRINLNGFSEFIEDNSQETLKTASENFHWMDWPTEWQSLRDYREIKLAQSDWTQVPDSPLDSTTKAAWATYRTKLRDIPSNAGAPIQIPDADWPLAPGESSIPEDAVRFVKSGDPLGLGTTSWIAMNTYTIPTLVQQTGMPIGAGIGTNIIKVDDVSVLKVGDTIKYKENEDSVKEYESTVSSIGSSVATNTSSGTVSLWPVSLGSTISVGLDTGSPLKYYDQIAQSNYYEQEKPKKTVTLGVSTTIVGGGDSLDITVSSKNVEDTEDLDYSISNLLPSDLTSGSISGTVQIVASSDRDVIGVSTISVTFASNISVAQTDSVVDIIIEIPSEGLDSTTVGISSI